MRRRSPLLPPCLLLTLLLAGAPAAAAEIPDYSLDDIAPSREERPEGWSPVVKSGVVPATAPTVGRLLAVAREAGIDAQAFHARSRPLQKADGTAGVIALVGVDAEPAEFTQALARAALAHGWQVREIGTPMRVSIAWSTSKEAGTELLTWQAHLAVRRLCDLVWKRVIAAQDRESFQRAVALLRIAGGLEPEAGAVHALRGRVFEAMRNPDEALASYRKALDEKAPVQAKPEWIVLVAGRVGHMLLLQEEEGVLEEALAALKRAVALEKHGENDLMRFGNRYNLACTFARLGRLDEAFAELERSLKIGKEALGDAYAQNHEHARTRDPDMEPLRKDPRFQKLMEKYAPSAGEGD